MKILQTAVLLAVVLIFTVVPVAFAQQMPAAACSVGFDLHMVGDHETHHEHHIGLQFDLNGDGQICVKHLRNGLHVHADNVVQ
jgi:hypothetical protein